MTVQMLFIPVSPVDGDVSLVDIEPDLDVLKGYLDGGWLEAVNLDPDWHAYVDEEGLLKRLPVNVRATMLVQQYTWSPVVLVGPAIFLGDTDEGEEADVPAEVVAKAQTLGFLA